MKKHWSNNWRFTSYFSFCFIRTSLYLPGSNIPVSESWFDFLPIFDQFSMLCCSSEPLRADLKWRRFFRRGLCFTSLLQITLLILCYIFYLYFITGLSYNPPANNSAIALLFSGSNHKCLFNRSFFHTYLTLFKIIFGSKVAFQQM